MQSNAMTSIGQDVVVPITTRLIIDKSLVERKIKEGMPKNEIHSTYYSKLNKMQWQKALVKMKLNNVRAPKIDFEIVECSQAECANTCEETNVVSETIIA